MKAKKTLACMASLVLFASMAVAFSGSAYGDTVSDADAAAYGVQLQGPVPLSARPSVAASAPNGSQEDALLIIPAPPALTSATARVVAQAETESTLDATLQATMDAQKGGLPKKWNARGYAVTEDLLAINETVSADVIESESVAACVGGKTVFGSAARIVNLTVGGQAVPIPNPSPNQVVFNQAGLKIVLWETNWDPATGRTTDGAATVFTNALHITAPGGVDLIVSHSEASATCAAAQDLKQCEDGRDNDGDGVIDEDDPGCHTDGDPNNPASYRPKDDDESDDGTLGGNLDQNNEAPPAPAVEAEPNFTG